MSPEAEAYVAHAETCEGCGSGAAGARCARGEALYGRAYEAHVRALRAENRARAAERG